MLNYFTLAVYLFATSTTKRPVTGRTSNSVLSGTNYWEILFATREKHRVNGLRRHFRSRSARSTRPGTTVSQAYIPSEIPCSTGTVKTESRGSRSHKIVRMVQSTQSGLLPFRHQAIRTGRCNLPAHSPVSQQASSSFPSITGLAVTKRCVA